MDASGGTRDLEDVAACARTVGWAGLGSCYGVELVHLPTSPAPFWAIARFEG